MTKRAFRRLPGARKTLPLLVVATLGISATACGGGGGGYELTARFDEAIALFEDSRVLLMGVEIGNVDKIEIDGDGILVTMSINDGVPIPADASAAIMPVSLIGARDVLVGPAWKPGDDKLAPGSEIENTMIPVEPDQALESITDLLTSLRPESITRILEEGANALDGNGSKINATVLELSQLIPYLAEQDEEFSAIAANLNTLANAVRSRDDEIAKLLADFATVTGTLAEERDQIISFVESVASLAREGKALLTAYEVTLPEDIDALASVALTLQANAGSVNQFLHSFNGFQNGVIEAYDPNTQTVTGRVFVSQSVVDQLESILDSLLGVG